MHSENKIENPVSPRFRLFYRYMQYLSLQLFILHWENTSLMIDRTIYQINCEAIHHYEWAKRTKFLLAVMYGSPRRHLSISKAFKNNLKKLNRFLMTILGLAESFRTINRPEPTRPDRNALWWLISQKVWKIGTWNFNTIFIQLHNLCY